MNTMWSSAPPPPPSENVNCFMTFLWRRPPPCAQVLLSFSPQHFPLKEVYVVLAWYLNISIINIIRIIFIIVFTISSRTHIPQAGTLGRGRGEQRWE